MGLSSGDYSRVLDLACSILDDTAGELPYGLITTELIRLLPSSGGFFMEVRLRKAAVRATAVSADWAMRPLDVLLDQCLTEHPLLRHYDTTGDGSVLTAVDIVGTRAWRNSQIRHTSLALLDADQHVSLPLPASPGVVRMFALGRPSDEYRADELTIAGTVQHLLIRLDNHINHYRRWRTGSTLSSTGLDAVMADLRLTPREITVLTLLAEALPAKQIAGRLGISCRTVHKHVENLYRKLGSGDRIAAVRRAQSAGILPNPETRNSQSIALVPPGPGSQ
jgi:DNA-binding CsgD family transcriptional regulator